MEFVDLSDEPNEDIDANPVFDLSHLDAAQFSLRKIVNEIGPLLNADQAPTLIELEEAAELLNHVLLHLVSFEKRGGKKYKRG